MNIQQLEEQLDQWHKKKFGETVNVPKTMRKLGEEFGEFIEAVMYGNPNCIAEEAVDVLFVMMHIVRHHCGTGSLSDAAEAKLEEIHRRMEEEKKPVDNAHSLI